MSTERMVLMNADAVRAAVAGELRLLDPAVRRSRHATSALLDEEFREFGASGAVWDRDSIVEALATEAADPPEVDDIVGTCLAPDVVLVTYRSRRPGRTTLRSSIWWRRGDRWLCRFHHGSNATNTTSLRSA